MRYMSKRTYLRIIAEKEAYDFLDKYIKEIEEKGGDASFFEEEKDKLRIDLLWNLMS